MDAEQIAAGQARWQARFDAARTRDADFTTLSGVEVAPVYGPTAADERMDRIGWPGEFPFTRGLYADRLPGPAVDDPPVRRLRQRPADQRALQDDPGRGRRRPVRRVRHAHADGPRLRRRRARSARSATAAWRSTRPSTWTSCSATSRSATSTTSMTISGPAVPIFCMYLVAAERQGADIGKLNGTLQTDIFKEYIAQKEWLFAPEPHLRLIGDLMEYCAHEIPAYKPLSVSGYHIREAGSTAAQELAFTLADGFGYVELGLSRGLDIEKFAPGLSFFFDAHIDFFEEIAKFRAARRIWARWLRDVYGAKTDKAQWLRFHTQTAGVSLTAQQPDNNIVRTAIEALAAVLGRHELAAHQRPRRGARAAERARRPDRAAHPAGDRRGDRRDERGRPARRLLVRRGAHRRARAPGRGDLRPDPGHGHGRHDDLAACCAASRTAGSWPRSPTPPSSTSSSWRRARRGSSASTSTPPRARTSWRSCGSATRWSASRSGCWPTARPPGTGAAVEAALAPHGRGRRGPTANMVPAMLDAARAEATLGEICDALRAEWGVYTETARF